MSHQDQVFMRTFIVVLAILAVMAIIFYVIAQNLAGDKAPDQMAKAAVAERIEPVGKVTPGDVSKVATAAASGPAVPPACMGCHGSGVLGAPKVGDKAAWEARAAQGVDALVLSAKNGKGGMPPQGGAFNDEQLKAAVEAMLKEAGL